MLLRSTWGCIVHAHPWSSGPVLPSWVGCSLESSHLSPAIAHRFCFCFCFRTQVGEDLTLKVWDTRTMHKPAQVFGKYVYFALARRECWELGACAPRAVVHACRPAGLLTRSSGSRGLFFSFTAWRHSFATPLLRARRLWTSAPMATASSLRARASTPRAARGGSGTVARRGRKRWCTRWTATRRSVLPSCTPPAQICQSAIALWRIVAGSSAPPLPTTARTATLTVFPPRIF